MEKGKEGGEGDGKKGRGWKKKDGDGKKRKGMEKKPGKFDF